MLALFTFCMVEELVEFCLRNGVIHVCVKQLRFSFR